MSKSDKQDIKLNDHEDHDNKTIDEHEEAVKKMLTDKQRLFVEEYVIDLKGGPAAVRAGYSPNGAAVMASTLLKNPNVLAYKEILMSKASRRTGISLDRVLTELARIGFADIRDVTDEEGRIDLTGSRDDTASIASYKVKTTTFGKEGNETEVVEREIKLHDKTKALESLKRHFDTREIEDDEVVIKIIHKRTPDDDEE